MRGVSDDIRDLDLALHCNQSCWLDDWWVIETSYGGRLGTADVEGTAAEMRDLARAIERRERASAKRCAAAVTPEGVLLWSPRNSIGFVRVPLARADALAAEIRRAVGDAPAAAPEGGRHG
jgi:hypothetical protein